MFFGFGRFLRLERTLRGVHYGQILKIHRKDGAITFVYAVIFVMYFRAERSKIGTAVSSPPTSLPTGRERSRGMEALINLVAREGAGPCEAP